MAGANAQRSQADRDNQAAAGGTPGGPAIVLRFAGPDSADLTMTSPGVTMMQTVAAAAYLSIVADQAVRGFLQRAAAQAIVPAGANLDAIIAQLSGKEPHA